MDNNNNGVFLTGMNLNNYCCFNNEHIIGFKKVNFFIGPNNSGKSAILKSISIYLRAYFLGQNFDDSIIFNDSRKKGNSANIDIGFTGNGWKANYHYDDRLDSGPDSGWEDDAENQIEVVHLVPHRHLQLAGERIPNKLSGDGFGTWISCWDEGRKIILNSFLTQILNLPAELVINGDQITINIDGSCFYFSHIGTGIMQAIIIAASAIGYQNNIICIDEPELHMHPKTQRQLLEFLLRTNDTNQYFIATHSASLINSLHREQDKEKIAVFLMKHDPANNSTTVSVVKGPDQREIFLALEDMGYHASDILQTNYVIMVEGPSDRIYIKHWIDAYLRNEKLEIALNEYEDYIFVNSGGNTLYVDEAEITEEEQDSGEADFDRKARSLLKLSQNLLVVVDSDLPNSLDKLKDGVKKRFKKKCLLIQDLKKNGGEGWITEGREIENFVPIELMTSILECVHPKVELSICYELEERKDYYESGDLQAEKTKKSQTYINFTNIRAGEILRPVAKKVQIARLLTDGTRLERIYQALNSKSVDKLAAELADSEKIFSKNFWKNFIQSEDMNQRLDYFKNPFSAQLFSHHQLKERIKYLIYKILKANGRDDEAERINLSAEELKVFDLDQDNRFNILD